MGREIKRVALDFNAPIGEVYAGFLNPHHVATKCEECDGSGSSPEARRLKDLWYGYVPFKPEDRGSIPFTPEDGAVRAFAERNISHAPDYYGRGELAIQREARRLCEHWNGSWSHHLNEGDVAALVKAGRLYDLTHTFDPVKRWQPKDPPYVPTPREVNIWSISGFGHDAINQWVCVNAECERSGAPNQCAACDGEGEHWPSPEAKKLYEDWTPVPLPAGEGYQLWSTTTEGTPMTPVFATPEDLALYCSSHAISTFGSETANYDTWLKFISGPAWAPSMIGHDGGVESGVAASVR